MAAIKKGTKLTDKPKDYMLRVRLDAETVQQLDECAEQANVSRSEIVREGIKQQHKKLRK